MNVRLVRTVIAVVALYLAGPASANADETMRLTQAQTSGGRASSVDINVDINHAGEKELRNLPGIGPARAHRIIAGRPYAAKDDLVKRNIIPKNVYEGIKDRIVVGGPQ